MKRLAKTFAHAAGPGAKSTKALDVENVIAEIGAAHEEEYRNRYIVGASLDMSTITAFYNSIPYHSPPLAVNLVSNALLSFLMPKNMSHTITVENQPLQPANKVSAYL